MTRFEVWAPTCPDPGDVEIEFTLPGTASSALGLVAGLTSRMSMVAVDPVRCDGEHGWWAVDADVPPGTRYRFVLHGEAFADPRSASQPEGIFGPSEVVDHTSFTWSAVEETWGGWQCDDPVIYETHVGTFTEAGTFAAAAEHLDHLVDLGVDVVELLPVAEFPGMRGWGYDGVFLSAPHSAYGGPNGLKRLVDACHVRGLAVLLDVVYNHFGPLGNVTQHFGPYMSERHRTPWGQAMNLDGPGSASVRRFFLENARMWMEEYRIDGLRLDAVHAIVDTSAVHLLEELADVADDVARVTGRPRYVVAESDLNDPRICAPRERGGYGIEAQWSDEVHHALHVLLTGERDGYYADFGTVSDLAHALRTGWVYDGRRSCVRERRYGRPTARWGLSSRSFVVCAQNHDQIGNRPRGDRLSASVDAAGLRLAAALTVLGPFTPMLFMGEEWAASTPWPYFTDLPDADLGRAVSEGRRQEFAGFGSDPEAIPDPQDAATYRSAIVSWDEVAVEPHASMLGWYRTLIGLRRTVPCLSNPTLGDLQITADDATRTLVMVRGTVMVACNFGAAPAVLDVDPGWHLVLAWDEETNHAGGALTLPPSGCVVARR